MRERRARLATDERRVAAAAAAARLAALPEMRGLAPGGAVLAGFMATRGEIDPVDALVAARQGGARVAFPRVVEGAPRLRFHLAAARDLRPGRFGILEPEASCPEVGASEIAVMIVPGLAFDPAGHRLGFGGGYYDEALAGRAAGVPPFVVGFGYDFQMVDSCPADDRDARVDCIVTDARVIRCGDPGSPAPQNPGSQNPGSQDPGSQDPGSRDPRSRDPRSRQGGEADA